MCKRNYDFLEIIFSLQNHQSKLNLNGTAPLNLYQYTGLPEGLIISEDILLGEKTCVWGPSENNGGRYSCGYQYR